MGERRGISCRDFLEEGHIYFFIIRGEDIMLKHKIDDEILKVIIHIFQVQIKTGEPCPPSNIDLNFT